MEYFLSCGTNLYWCVEKECSKKQEIEALLQKSKIEFELNQNDWLEDLIERARKALFLAEKANKIKQDEELVMSAKNNLAYYLTIARINKEEVREIAGELYKKFKRFPGWYHYVDTYIWALWCFAKDEIEKQKAREIFRKLYSQKETIPDKKFKTKLERYKSLFY